VRAKKPIKLVVKKVGKLKFLKATGGWSKKIEMAFPFPNLLNAIHTCLVRGLEQVELVVRFEGESTDRCYFVNLA
jgi:hypothetical protein